jgi:PAS domain S-box-containing protein
VCRDPDAVTNRSSPYTVKPRSPSTTIRYLFAILTVAIAFALRLWLIPLTGTGAPFPLFYSTVLLTSLFAGVGPGVCALLFSLAISVSISVIRAGTPPSQAALQGLLFAMDGTLVIYLTFFMEKWRRAAEDSMAHTHEVIELASDAFFQADLTSRLTDVNRAACRLLGYERNELLGRTIVDIIPPADVPRLLATRDHLLSPEVVEVGEWTLIRRDGTPVPVEVSANILPDGRWQAFVRDIGERKRIERALQESEERFRLTIEEAPIGMALVALDGRFVRVNRALCEIVGYTSTELAGLTFQAITHPDDIAADSAAAGQLVRGEISRYQRDKRYLSKDGTIVDAMLSVSVLRDREGTPCYFISQIADIRERKRTDMALKESEQRLNLALESGQVGMWDLDLVTDRAVRSLRHDQIFGYSSPIPEWGVAIFLEHVLPEDREAARQAIESGATTGNFDMECRILWADGSIHWISARGRAYRNPQGEPVRMMGTVVDITEHKRADEALERREREFRELAESMPQIVWIAGADGLNVYFNRQWVDYTGLTLEESRGEGWITPFHPDDRTHAWNAWQHAMQSHDVYSLECRLRSADGVYRWWLVRGVPLLDENGNVRKWFGTCTDIEQIKVAEREQQLLVEAGALMGATLDYEQTLVTVARLIVRDFADWCVVAVTDEHEQFRRLKVVSAEPTNAELCMHLEQLALDHNRPFLVRSAIETKQPLLIEDVSPEQLEAAAQGPEYLQALRAVSPRSLMAVPLLMRGQLLGAIAFVSSSPSRAYGSSDLRVAEALADRAAVAIENARLYRTSVNATGLRDRVLGVVAHDLRNPLSAIQLQAGTLTRGGPEPERRSQKAVEAIQSIATRMNRLIQDLLDVALMESGQLTVEPARLFPRELIAAALDLQRPLASSSFLELRIEVDADVPEIWGDRDRLLQVFENLIGNAIKFTEAGGRITAGAASREGEVVFWVADTGSGIPSEDLLRVFDRFWRTTMGGRQGAGLGLPITKGIVEAHGGRIWVTSTPGHGTTFSFTIPKAAPEQDVKARSGELTGAAAESS